METKDIIVILSALASLAIIFIVARKFWDKLHEEETMKYEFVTIIAHKFRTPLSQIKWLMEGILEKETDSYKLEDLRNVHQSNEKLIGLTNTLIEVTDSAKKGSLLYAFEKVNIPNFVNQELETLKNDFHAKNIFCNIQCTEPEIFANIDKPRMEFVLHTLFENAINYSPVGRSVDVSISIEKKKAVISITDNGIGIDPADLGHVFGKFFRSQDAKKMDTEGFGIGLFLAQSIVERHKGKIEVFSEGLNKGSTFVLSLPLA
ncbi:MAG: HAMP domain-containing sensor histidine kinase [Patescibacteria group bacterium]